MGRRQANDIQLIRQSRDVDCTELEVFYGMACTWGDCQFIVDVHQHILFEMEKHALLSTRFSWSTSIYFQYYWAFWV